MGLLQVFIVFLYSISFLKFVIAQNMGLLQVFIVFLQYQFFSCTTGQKLSSLQSYTCKSCHMFYCLNGKCPTTYLSHISSQLDFCGDHFCARSRGAIITKARSPTQKENSPTRNSQSVLVVHYSLNFTAYKNGLHSFYFLILIFTASFSQKEKEKKKKKPNNVFIFPHNRINNLK